MNIQGCASPIFVIAKALKLCEVAGKKGRKSVHFEFFGAVYEVESLKKARRIWTVSSSAHKSNTVCYEASVLAQFVCYALVRYLSTNLTDQMFRHVYLWTSRVTQVEFSCKTAQSYGPILLVLAAIHKTFQKWTASMADGYTGWTRCDGHLGTLIYPLIYHNNWVGSQTAYSFIRVFYRDHALDTTIDIEFCLVHAMVFQSILLRRNLIEIWLTRYEIA